MLWDFVDIGMAAKSWYDLLKDPTLLNVTWAILDTAAIAPLIPSSAYIREGAKYTIKLSEIEKLAQTSSGRDALRRALRITEGTSIIRDISSLAKNYILTESRYGHILEEHAFNSTVPNKSRYISTADIKSLINKTLTDDSVIRNNSKNRDGYIFEKYIGSIIGYDGNQPCYSIRVILSTTGDVITAFPIK